MKSILPQRAHRAFTLTELLVVIGIVSLLVLIAVPQLQNQLKLASRTKCAQRLRQIHMGCTAYAGDNNGLYPVVNNGYWGPNYFPANIYNDTLKPYIGDRNQVMFCPGDLYKLRNPQVTSPDYATSYITYQYFNYNGNFSGTLGGAKKPNLTRTTTAPTDLPLWGCMTSLAGKTAYAHHEPGVARPFTGMNIVCVDGSARWVNGSDLEAYAYSASIFYWPIPTNR